MFIRRFKKKREKERIIVFKSATPFCCSRKKRVNGKYLSIKWKIKKKKKFKESETIANAQRYITTDTKKKLIESS